MNRILERIIAWMTGIVVGLTAIGLFLFGTRVIEYTNRGFQIADAIAWTAEDARYELGLNRQQDDGDIPEWFDGVVNDNIVDWNWQNF